LTLEQVFDKLNIPLDADKLHTHFREAAINGGGWVSYDWVIPSMDNSTFQKIAYIFQMTIEGRSYYGGVGFRNQPAATFKDADYGKKANGEPIPCSQSYGLNCSEKNVESILGEALTDLTLASSGARVAVDNKRSLDIKTVLMNIHLYSVNDFYVSVFSNDGSGCAVQDGSGCCVAHGLNSSLVNKTWQQILDSEGITSIRGVDLHAELIAQSSDSGGWYGYSWSKSTGVAQLKRSRSARFRYEGKSFYVVAEYLTTQFPSTCDNCPQNMECTHDEQYFCKEKPSPSLRKEPVFVFLVMLFSIGTPCIVGVLLLRSWRQKRRHREKRRALEDQIKGMHGMMEVVHEMQIQSPAKYQQLFGGSQEAGASATSPSAKWYWEEDPSFLCRHNPETILNYTNYVSYLPETVDLLEDAFQRWKKKLGGGELNVNLTKNITKVNNPATGANFKVHFETMQQINLYTNHWRNIKREEVGIPIDPEVRIKLPTLPGDVHFFGKDAEELLPTFKGQVIQVSKSNADKKWLFGNVLYDPVMIEALKQSKAAQSDDLNRMVANVLHDRPTSGWFPKCVTKPADAEIMKKLLTELGAGEANTLATPTIWERDKEGRVPVRPEKHPQEYQKVTDFFHSKLLEHAKSITVLAVERVQNPPLWQTVSVKIDTMKRRDKENPQHIIHNKEIERRWLFHGTTSAAVDKIAKQGFNRAFAGRNATAYGKGVYFARDASYSILPTYSAPDQQGVQRVFLCRVAVGDWCIGTTNNLIPDPKPHSPFELFDSTVDNVRNPSIFVVYHDSQVYPEYLVSFRRNK
jgi:hypothetical protein